jgi:hypothetical protein
MNITASALALVGVVLAGPTGTSLRGTVVDSQGKPIAGARVNIATAAPRVGRAIFCPSCYLDCAKWTTSDSQGAFEIRGLDPTLKFTVLASASNKRSRVTKLVDPVTGDVKITLDALPTLPPERMVLGELVDDRGQAIAGALVEPYGAKTSDRQWWGPVKVDAVVSDAAGGFRLILPEDYQAVDVDVSAYGYAGVFLPLLRPGLERQRFVVPAGTRVTARVVHAGQRVAGLRVAVAQADRAAGRHFIKAVGGITDGDGNVAFDHLPANEQYVIFTQVGKEPQELVFSTKKFKAYGNREERKLGDLATILPKQVAGRVELTGGQSLPLDARVALDRDPAWDLIAVPVSKDGTFVIKGLPPETYRVRVAAGRFSVDSARMPYQMLDGRSFGLAVRESIDDLRIPLAPSEP